MSDFTYNPPKGKTFIKTMRTMLAMKGDAETADLLDGADGELSSDGTFSRVRWDGWDAQFRLRVPVDRLPKFTKNVRATLLRCAQELIPLEVGYDLSEVIVTPILDEEEENKLPEIASFMHTLRSTLEKPGRTDLVALLLGVDARFQTRGRTVKLELRVPVDRIEAYEAAQYDILNAGRLIVRSCSSYHLEDLDVLPLVEAPPDGPLPAPVFKPERCIQHDGLWFRSKTEIRIYEALKKRDVFFFVNASGVLGGKLAAGRPALREPDFLVCLDGKWGILEVMGEHVHTRDNAPRDHNRAREMKRYGITMIEFFDATRCYSEPERVVDEFLGLLAKT